MSSNIWDRETESTNTLYPTMAESKIPAENMSSTLLVLKLNAYHPNPPSALYSSGNPSTSFFLGARKARAKIRTPYFPNP